MRYISVFSEDKELLIALSDIFIKGESYDLDCTYSKGIFYQDIQKPKLISDLIPTSEEVVQADSTELHFIEDNSVKSIVFDPPFLFRDRQAVNNDKMCQRFSYFKTFDELMEMYRKSLDCFKRKLTKGGYVFFKCQDMTDGKFYCTHNEIINYAIKNGYELKDIAIKATTKKLQRDAKQQNCVAKVHSYWLALRKK